MPSDPPEGPLMVASVEVKVYKRRWWILFLFAGMGFMQVREKMIHLFTLFVVVCVLLSSVIVYCV